MFFNLWSVCEGARLGEVGVVFSVFLIIIVMDGQGYYLHEVLHVTSHSCRLRSLNAIPCLALAEDSGHEQYSINRIQVLRLRLTQYKFLGVFFLVGWWWRWHFPSLSEQYL